MGISNRALLRNLTTNGFRRLRRQASTRPGAQPRGFGAAARQNSTEVELDWEAWAWDMADALGKAMDDWKSMATLSPIAVNSGIGMIQPGSIVGPQLSSLTPAHVIHDGNAEITAIRSGITDEVSNAWQAWHGGLHGPLQFPTLMGGTDLNQPTSAPCMPTMLSALGSSGSVFLDRQRLKAILSMRLAAKNVPELDHLVEAMARAVETTFQTFKVSTVIVDVQANAGIALGGPGFLR